MRSSEAIGRLFDYAVEHPDGFTYQDVEADLGWPRAYFTKVHRKLRLMLGNDDQINLVCDAQGQHQPWRYRLVGNVEGAREWVSNRLRDTESRITTQQAVAASLVSATDGRTLAGRRARAIELALRHLIEQLALLDHGNGPLF